MMLKKQFQIIVVLLCVMLATLPLMGFAQSNEPVVIGSIFPSTGGFEYEGIDCDRAVTLATEEINAAGGVNGRLLKVIHEDSRSSHAGGMDAVHKLVDVDRVPAIVGAYSSGISVPTHTYASAHKVIMMSTSSSNKLRNCGPYSFNSLGLDEHLGPKLGKFTETLGYKRVSFIIVNNACGVSVLEKAKAYFKKHGVKVLDVAKYEFGQADYRPELQKAFRHNPEAILLVAYTNGGRLILKQAAELGLKDKAQWIFGYFLMATGNVIPETAEGIIGLAPYSPVAPDSRCAHFRDIYQKKYNEPPRSSWSAYIYDATWIIAIAINLAGTDKDTDKIRHAMFTAAEIYRGASGGGDKRVDKDGQQIDEVYYPLIYREGKTRSLLSVFPDAKYYKDGTIVGLSKEDFVK